MKQKKIIAFAGSNSRESINKKLAVYTASLIDNINLEILDLNDFPLPIYGIDEENNNGIPTKAKEFLKIIHSADGIILSLAEHNGNFSTVFKNIFDWSSRIEKKIWNDVPMFVMSTSPGARGGLSVLSVAKNVFPYLGGNIVEDFTLPSFFENFKEGKIVNEDLLISLKKKVSTFQNKVIL